MDLMKNMFLTGLGIAVLTKEKLDEFAQDVVKKSNMTQEEGRRFVSDLLNQSERARKDMEAQIDEAVKKRMETMGFATKDDVNRLEQKLDTLLEQRSGSSS